MASILALDYGTKRTGIAVSDPEQRIAFGLTTVHTPELFPFLEKYFGEEQVDTVVVGLPVQKDGSPSPVEKEITAFLKKFEKRFPDKKVDRMDERYTSQLAFQSMIDGGLKKKKRRDKALVDEISATMILQDYLSK